jgi:hypothetical protein
VEGVAAVPHNVVVPLLGSPDPKHLVTIACGLAGDDGTVDAVVVIELSPLLPLDARMDEEEAAARRLLARARAVGVACGVRFVPHIVRAREAASAILELAEHEDAEIVVADGGGRRLPRAERRLVRRAPDRVIIV